MSGVKIAHYCGKIDKFSGVTISADFRVYG